MVCGIEDPVVIDMKTLYESILGSNNASLPKDIHKFIEYYKDKEWSYLHANGDINRFDNRVPSYSIETIIRNITEEDFYEILKRKINNLYHAKDKKDRSQYFTIFGKNKETFFLRIRKVTKDFWYCSWETREWVSIYRNWETDEYFFPFDHTISFFHRPKPQEISNELLKELRKQKFEFE